MRQTVFWLVVAAVLLANCDAISISSKRQHLNDNPTHATVLTGEKRILRGSNIKTDSGDDDDERGGFFSSLFKAKTIGESKQSEAVKGTIALLEGLKGKTGKELDEAIAAAAKSSNVGAESVRQSFRFFKIHGVKKTHKKAAEIVEIQRKIDEDTNSLIKRIEGKP